METATTDTSQFHSKTNLEQQAEIVDAANVLAKAILNKAYERENEDLYWQREDQVERVRFRLLALATEKIEVSVLAFGKPTFKLIICGIGRVLSSSHRRERSADRSSPGTRAESAEARDADAQASAD